MCDVHPWGLIDGLSCDRDEPHIVGHTFHSTSVDDGHTASERRAEETRG